MNKYKVLFESSDNRLFEVTVRADGISETHDLVVFWRRAFWFFRRNAHFIAKDAIISVIGESENK